MEMRPLLRPAAQLLNGARPAASLPLIPSRGHKTTARTKRSLKLAPHDSFLPTRSASYPAADSIIYNPPSSEASPSHTPFIFLPRNDSRRLALLRMRGNPGAPSLERSGELPPAMSYKHRAASPRYHLKEEDVAEMKRLRAEDPLQWSVGHLAKKFDCSPVFVQMAAPAPAEHLQWLKGKMDRKVARWGPKKSQAREDRKTRTEMMYRGEL